MAASANLTDPQTPQAHERLETETRTIWYMAFFSGLALIFVALRVVSRLMQWGRLKGHDILLLAATVQMLAMNALFVVAMKQGGFGRHVAHVSMEQLVFFKKSYFAAGIVMPTCYASAKLSMLWLLDDVFAQSNLRRVLRVLEAVVIFWWLGTVFLDTFLCIPIDARWSNTARSSCNERFIQAEYLSTPIPWIVTDFLILAVPLPALWKGMTASRAKQIGLVALFGIGVATCGVAIKRYTTLLYINADDLTFSMVEPCIWTMIESSTTIICAALPASTFALRRILPLRSLRITVEFLESRLDRFMSKSTKWSHPGAANIPVTQTPMEPAAAYLPRAKSWILPV